MLSAEKVSSADDNSTCKCPSLTLAVTHFPSVLFQRISLEISSNGASHLIRERSSTRAGAQGRQILDLSERMTFDL